MGQKLRFLCNNFNSLLLNLFLLELITSPAGSDCVLIILLSFLVPGHLSHRCTIHSLRSQLQTIIPIESLYVLSVSEACTIKITFVWIAQMHTECVPLEPTVTHHSGHQEQNLENPILISGRHCLKVV